MVGKIDDFSIDEAKIALQISYLPHAYEVGQKANASPVTLKQQLADTMHTDKDNIQVLQVKNTTCVMVYNPKDNSLTLAFDPTFNKRDYMDNFFRSPTDHPLGGEVHSGNFKNIIEDHGNPNLPQGNMVDMIKAVAHDYQSRSGAPLTVNFTGFSQGGGQAVLVAGALMADDFFDSDTMKLGKVYNFGALAVGDEQFNKAFEDKAAQLGGRVYSIEIQGDKNNTVLTPDGGSLFTRYGYDQTGTSVFISTNASAPAIVIDPSDTQLRALREIPASMDRPHSYDGYKTALDQASSDGTLTTFNIPSPPVSAPAP